MPPAPNRRLIAHMKALEIYGQVTIDGVTKNLNDLIGTWELERWLQRLENNQDWWALANAVRAKMEKTIRLEMNYHRLHMSHRVGIFLMDEEVQPPRAPQIKTLPHRPPALKAPRYQPKREPKKYDYTKKLKAVGIKTNGKSLLTLELALAAGMLYLCICFLIDWFSYGGD
jgi:hypothetical protein